MSDDDLVAGITLLQATADVNLLEKVHHASKAQTKAAAQVESDVEDSTLALHAESTPPAQSAGPVTSNADSGDNSHDLELMTWNWPWNTYHKHASKAQTEAALQVGSDVKDDMLAFRTLFDKIECVPDTTAACCLQRRMVFPAFCACCLIPSVVLIPFVGFSADGDGNVIKDEVTKAFGDASAGDKVLKDCDANADGTHLANCFVLACRSGHLRPEPQRHSI